MKQKHVIPYALYEKKVSSINEGLFDRIGAFFNKVMGLFNDTEKVDKGLNSAIEELGEDKVKKWVPKDTKIDDTIFVKLGVEGSDEGFSVAFTKMAEFSDGGGLFQITGSTSEEMLNALVGSKNIPDLVEKSVMAMIPAAGFEADKNMEMVILKNIIPDGKPYTSDSVVKAIAPGMAVEKGIASAQ